jgi:hypothetical protein
VEGDRFKKRKYHMNRMMSKSVCTRSPEQCRSHHQKMLKCYGNISNIVRHIQSILGLTSGVVLKQVSPSTENSSIVGMVS